MPRWAPCRLAQFAPPPCVLPSSTLRTLALSTLTTLALSTLRTLALSTLCALALSTLCAPAVARADVIPSAQSVRCPPGASADPHAARCVADACAGDCGPIAACLPRKLCVTRGSTHGGGSVTIVHSVCASTEDCGERGVCEELDVCVYPEESSPRASAGPSGCGQCGASHVRGTAAGVALACGAGCALVLRRARRRRR